MSEPNKTLLVGGAVGGVVVLVIVLAWSIVSQFGHECRPAAAAAAVCVVCGSSMLVAR